MKQQTNLLEHAHEIDGYVSELTRSMGRAATEEDKEEIREELRQHIETMAAAEQELGATETEAVRNALARFGDAKTIGKQLAQERRARLLSTQLRFCVLSLALGMACASLAAAALAHFVPVFAAISLAVCGGYFVGRATERRHPGAGIDASLLLAWVLPYFFAIFGTALNEFAPHGFAVGGLPPAPPLFWYGCASGLGAFCLMAAAGAYVAAARRIGHGFAYPLARIAQIPFVYCKATLVMLDLPMAAVRLPHDFRARALPFVPLPQQSDLL